MQGEGAKKIRGERVQDCWLSLCDRMFFVSLMVVVLMMTSDDDDSYSYQCSKLTSGMGMLKTEQSKGKQPKRKLKDGKHFFEKLKGGGVKGGGRGEGTRYHNNHCNAKKKVL